MRVLLATRLSAVMVSASPAEEKAAVDSVSTEAAPAAKTDDKPVKPSLKPYGFIKGDMYYVAGGSALSWGKQAITCVSLASDTGGRGISFTAQHSRFGLDGSIAFKKMEIGGKLELDFFVVDADANAVPRIRQGYAWVRPLKCLDLRFGQQWDLFSPLNPTTNNTKANLWYSGNYGFRRPQCQLRYTAPLKTVKPGIQLSIGETAKEKAGTGTIGADNLSGQPLYQGRVNAVLPLGIDVGVSGMYATYGTDGMVETWGISADLNAPVSKYVALTGEFAYGSNLNNADNFTIGGSGGKGSAAVTNNGMWVGVVSKPLRFLNVAGGYAVENLTRPVAGKPKANTTFYGDLIIVINQFFELTLEAQRIITSYGYNDATVNVLDVSGKIIF